MIPGFLVSYYMGVYFNTRPPFSPWLGRLVYFQSSWGVWSLVSLHDLPGGRGYAISVFSNGLGNVWKNGPLDWRVRGRFGESGERPVSVSNWWRRLH